MPAKSNSDYPNSSFDVDATVYYDLQTRLVGVHTVNTSKQPTGVVSTKTSEMNLKE